MNTEIKMKKMYKEPQTDIFHEMEDLMKVSATSDTDTLQPKLAPSKEEAPKL